MFSANQLLDEIGAFANGDISFGEFEDWFRTGSIDVNLCEDSRLLESVFVAESLFSEYHFANLGQDNFREELVKCATALHFAMETFAPNAEKVFSTNKVEESEFRGFPILRYPKQGIDPAPFEALSTIPDRQPLVGCLV